MDVFVTFRKAFYNLIIKSQSFSRSVSLDCELHKQVSAFFNALGETERLLGIRAG